MRTKDFTARVKAAGVADGLAEGQFVALVSVFDNEDSMGDIVRPGAFTETLADWAAKGDPIPVIWSHNWGDPFAHIGTVIKAVETLQGLEVTGQIDDLGDNPTADQVYRLLKGRRVTQFSFAYDVVEDAWVRDDEHPWGGYLELRKLKLHEVGPCLVGANQETELLAAKAADIARGAKAGRVLSQSNYERLTEARDAISEVLASADAQKNATTSSTPAGPQEVEETVTPSTEEPGQPGAAAADGEQPSAQPADTTPPAKGAEEGGFLTPDQLREALALVREDTQKGLRELIEQAMAKALGKGVATESISSTEDETTPDPREASEDAAKAGTAASRLLARLDLDLVELGA